MTRRAGAAGMPFPPVHSHGRFAVEIHSACRRVSPDQTIDIDPAVPDLASDLKSEDRSLLPVRQAGHWGERDVASAVPVAMHKGARAIRFLRNTVRILRRTQVVIWAKRSLFQE